MTMIAHPGFMKAIIANPADDTPRLIYADWLEDHGEAERGELIRLQVEIAQLEKAIGDRVGAALTAGVARDESDNLRRLRQLWRRDKELLEKNRQEWFILLGRRPGFGENEPLRWWPVASNDDEVADRIGLTNDNVPIMSAAMEGRPTRGFLSHIRCVEVDWLRHGNAIVREHPIERVTLSDKRPAHYPGNYNLPWQWHWVDLSDEEIIALSVEVYNSVLPSSLWHNLPKAMCKTEQAAMDALSQACLRLARSA